VRQEQGIGTIKFIMPPIIRTGDAIGPQRDAISVFVEGRPYLRDFQRQCHRIPELCQRFIVAGRIK